MPRLAEATRDAVQSETRRLLLEAAAAEFAENGFAGANINQISLAAGFAKGTIYNYFPSKRALMQALIEEVASNHIEFITQRVERAADPDARLQAFFEAGFAFVEQHPLQARIAISSVFGHDEGFRERIFAAYEALFILIDQQILNAGIKRGHYRPLDSDMITALLMSLYLGSCSLLGPDGKMWLDPALVAEFVTAGIHHPGRPPSGRNGHE